MTYTIRAGDTLFLIAQRNGISLNDLIAANPQIKDPDLIYPGQVITIPEAPAQPVAPEIPGKPPAEPVEPGIAGEKPLRFISARENTKELQGAIDVPLSPQITLRFDKNVISDNVWQNNQNSITLSSAQKANVPLNFSRVPETVDFSQRVNIFLTPVQLLRPNTSYNLNISPRLRSKAGETLAETTGGKGVTINFRTRG
ncbi:MAG: LysM peptidoglycan-binding domain-containing protein [Desulfotomaculaceae bacterium]|nr:LysM peptidoglycan-binding domain-containing protein [Desulfotomaculaceae bacterium]